MKLASRVFGSDGGKTWAVRGGSVFDDVQVGMCKCRSAREDSRDRRRPNRWGLSLQLPTGRR